MTVPGRLAILTLDSKCWLEVYKTEGKGVRVEFHEPKREASVGYVDSPTVSTGPLDRAVRNVLADTEFVHAADELVEALQVRLVSATPIPEENRVML
jgi:hypothetical protein